MFKFQSKNLFSDKVFVKLTGGAALVVLALMFGFFIQLIYHSTPAIRNFGFDFIISREWDPVRSLYGAAPAIYGTLITTIIALLLAVPLSFIIALFLVEIAHPVLAGIFEHAIDLLAAIPSIIFGMWGLFVLIPIMQNYIVPALRKIPFLGSCALLEGNCSGSGFLTAGMVLALMILPFICAVMRNVFRMVPAVVKESAYGVGATRLEVCWSITRRYGMQGMLGAVFLGLGRAVGETMAVLFVIGNNPAISKSLLAPGTTIAATLANNFAEAEGIFKASLFELGLILLIISFIIQSVSQLWLNKVKAQSGGGL